MVKISSTRYFLDVVNFHKTLFREFILFLNPSASWFIFYAMQQVVNISAMYCVEQRLLFIANEAQSHQYLQ